LIIFALFQIFHLFLKYWKVLLQPKSTIIFLLMVCVSNLNLGFHNSVENALVKISNDLLLAADSGLLSTNSDLSALLVQYSVSLVFLFYLFQ